MSDELSSMKRAEISTWSGQSGGPPEGFRSTSVSPANQRFEMRAGHPCYDWCS